MSGGSADQPAGLDDPAAWAVPVQPGVPDTRQVPAEPTDTQMLDWLERNNAGIDTSDLEGDAHVVMHRRYGNPVLGPVRYGIRAAIAAAMRNQP